MAGPCMNDLILYVPNISFFPPPRVLAEPLLILSLSLSLSLTHTRTHTLKENQEVGHNSPYVARTKKQGRRER